MPDFKVQVRMEPQEGDRCRPWTHHHTIQAASYALAAAKALDQGVKMPKGAVVHLRIQRVEGT